MVSRSLFRFEQAVVEIFQWLHICRASGFRVSWMCMIESWNVFGLSKFE